MISIVIPTHNHCDDLLKPCIDSILKYTDLSDIELIVVANGCTDNTKSFLSEYKLNYIWFDEALGYTKAINEGIKIAKGDYILLLNNDVVLLEQKKNTWINMLLSPHLDKSINCGVSGPIKSKQVSLNKDFIVFFCCLIKRELFDKIGLLNEEYSPGGMEDVEFCILASNLGYDLVQVPNDFTNVKKEFVEGGFPIYHIGEATMECNPEWNNIFLNNVRKIVAKFSLPDGWFSDADIKEYRRLVGSVPDGGSICELGVWKGRSICSVADLVLRKNLRVVCVDTFEGTVGEEESHKFAKENDLKKVFEDNVKRFGLSPVVYKATTNEAALLVDEKFDLIFIDADHSFEAISLDIDNWLPKSKGVICGHDYLTWKSVTDAVNSKFKFVSFGGSVWSFGSKHHVVVDICTKDRYFSTLPLTLSSVINQTVLPDEIIIVDDSDFPVDLRKSSIFTYLFKLCEAKGIKWSVLFGKKQGQHYSHQLIQSLAKDLVFRIDDDVIADPNCLEVLLSNFDSNVGAVGGIVAMPGAKFKEVDSSINNVFENQQWYLFNEKKFAEHLYSTFLYRAKVVDYELSLSKEASREETIFSHNLFRKGYKLVLDPKAVCWHLRNPEGGIRGFDPKFKASDEKIFNEIRREWDGELMAYLDNGIGDHIVFKSILPELKKKYKRVIIACCYPEIFSGEEVISVSEARNWITPERFNVYKFMIDNNWDKEMVLAMVRLYDNNCSL